MKILLNVLLFFTLSIPVHASGGEQGQPKTRVIIADVVKSRLIALDPRPGMAGASNHWRVTLKNMRVISGEDPAPSGRVTVDVFLDDTYLWTKQGRVALVVSYTSEEDLKVIGWSPIYESICIPSEYVPAGYSDRYVPKQTTPGFSCTNVP